MECPMTEVARDYNTIREVDRTLRARQEMKYREVVTTTLFVVVSLVHRGKKMKC
jgi:hypothetical protein